MGGSSAVGASRAPTPLPSAHNALRRRVGVSPSVDALLRAYSVYFCPEGQSLVRLILRQGDDEGPRASSPSPLPRLLQDRYAFFVMSLPNSALGLVDRDEVRPENHCAAATHPLPRLLRASSKIYYLGSMLNLAVNALFEEVRPILSSDPRRKKPTIPLPPDAE